MAGCSWLLFREPRCQATIIVAAETNLLAVILLYYQRNRRALEYL